MEPHRELIELLSGRQVAVLSGAGCSTESGIPDYRGPETRRRARDPVEGRDFVNDEATRRRYWSRSVVGWPRFRAARPNPAHHALAELERAGLLTGIVTQNVDRLHQAAGSERVVELHGALAEVRCLACEVMQDRDEVQRRLEAANPDFLARASAAALAPDGDADVERDVEAFVVPDCPRCGGVLKPHVVFFGEGVPKPRVAAAWEIVHEADVLLVVGSSLVVYSGFRFVRGAAKRGQRIAMLNLGETRGDPYADVVVAERAGEVLPGVCRALIELD